MLNAKLFIQELWKQKLEWGEIFSESLQKEWFKVYEDLTPLSAVPIPRYIGGDDYNLFCFTDAPAKAYSASVYLYSTVAKTANINLVFSSCSYWN